MATPPRKAPGWIAGPRLRVGRLATATTGGDVLYLVRHENLATTRVSGDGTEAFHPGIDDDESLDDRDIHVALDGRGTLLVLDGEGRVGRRERGGPLQPIVEAGAAAAGHYAHRVGFVWDAAGRRLVIVGGDSRNDTWVLPEGESRLSALRTPGPTHGYGSTVATRHGVYHLVADELWRLDGDRWSFVAPDPHRAMGRKALLLHDPRQDRLFSIAQTVHGERGAPALVPIGEQGFGTPLPLPGDLTRVFDYHDEVLGYDPGGDRLLWVTGRTARQLPLAGLLPPVAAPPTWALPPPRSRVARAPLHWHHEAVCIGGPVGPRLAPVLEVPGDRVVLATFPESPHLPFEKGSGLVLIAQRSPWEHDAGTLSFENAFEVRVVEEPLPLAIDDGKGLVPRGGHRFLDVDPTHARRVETRRHGEPFLSRRSKIGGFPWLVQGGREEAASAPFADLKCESCYTTLRFAAQLSQADTDWFMSGMIYVYLCPFGCMGAARAQSG